MAGQKMPGQKQKRTLVAAVVVGNKAKSKTIEIDRRALGGGGAADSGATAAGGAAGTLKFATHTPTTTQPNTHQTHTALNCT